MRVDLTPLSSSEERSGSGSQHGERIGESAIRCAGCGIPGPAEHHGGRSDPGRCHRGRRMVVLALPFRVRGVAPTGSPLHNPARDRPRGDGRGLSGPAQPDGSDGGPEADHARDGDHAHGHRPVLSRDVGHQPVAASQRRRMVRAGNDPRPVLVRDGVRRRLEPRGTGQGAARPHIRRTRPAGSPARSSRAWSRPTGWASSIATSSPRTS